jgi:hypothetical protein
MVSLRRSATDGLLVSSPLLVESISGDLSLLFFDFFRLTFVFVGDFELSPVALSPWKTLLHATMQPFQQCDELLKYRQVTTSDRLSIYIPLSGFPSSEPAGSPPPLGSKKARVGIGFSSCSSQRGSSAIGDKYILHHSENRMNVITHCS